MPLNPLHKDFKSSVDLKVSREYCLSLLAFNRLYTMENIP